MTTTTETSPTTLDHEGGQWVPATPRPVEVSTGMTVGIQSALCVARDVYLATGDEEMAEDVSDYITALEGLRMKALKPAVGDVVLHRGLLYEVTRSGSIAGFMVPLSSPGLRPEIRFDHFAVRVMEPVPNFG